MAPLPHRRVDSGRRDFLQFGVSASAALLAAPWQLDAAEAEQARPARLAFAHQPPHFSFDTGALRGALRQGGLSRGLMPLTDAVTETPIARGYGVFSHYRLLDAQRRYGDGAWSWPTRARRLDDGAVVIEWEFDATCPFAMQAVYRWAAPQTLDLVTTVTARRDVERLEVFLASYFEGFPVSRVYVQGDPRTGGRPGFAEAARQQGHWLMYPRDHAAVRTIQDGRWERLPHPVQWQIQPELAAPLAMRRDPDSGLTALVMARPQDCFAVATPYGEESHRSLYLSLFGGDMQAGSSAEAHTRLVIGRDLSDQAAIECYERFIESAVTKPRS